MNPDAQIGEIVNITGVLTDVDGNPIANALVTVMVDGKSYTVRTDAQGRWLLSYQTVRTGIISTSISSDESDEYFGFINYGFFNVFEKDTTGIPN